MTCLQSQIGFLRGWSLLAGASLLSSARHSRTQGCMKNGGLSHFCFSLFPVCTIDTCTMTGRFLSTLGWLDLHQFTPIMSAGERRRSKFGTLLFSHDCYVVKHLIARLESPNSVGLLPLGFSQRFNIFCSSCLARGSDLNIQWFSSLWSKAECFSEEVTGASVNKVGVVFAWEKTKNRVEILGRDNDLQFMLHQMMFVNLVNNRSKGWKPLKYVFFTVSVTFLQKGKILKIQFNKTIEFSKNTTSVLRDYCCY